MYDDKYTPFVTVKSKQEMIGSVGNNELKLAYGTKEIVEKKIINLNHQSLHKAEMSIESTKKLIRSYLKHKRSH